MKARRLLCALTVSVTSLLAGCQSTAAISPAAASAKLTTIAIEPATLHTGVKRLGINLSGQTYYDSGQMLRNLTFRNPGFEGETWRSILRCKTASATTCTDENQYAVWPAGFLDHASYEVLSGPAKGALGTVESSSAASQGRGVTLTLRKAGGGETPGAGDFVLVSADKPGDAQAGWWSSLNGGASLSTEFHNLPPNSPGRQALHIAAAGAGQSATLSSYFDSYAGRSFLQLRGRFTLTFRARADAGGKPLNVRVERLDTLHGARTFLRETVPLTPAWRDYSFEFNAQEDGTGVGTVGLSFAFAGTSAWLDDVALTAAASPGNPTAFRDEVVQALRDLKPGVLRCMDNGTSFGSSLDNLLAVPLARRRAGSSTQETVREDISIGLHECLTLAHAVGAEPWYTLPPATSPAEAANLVQYLAGSASTRYGTIRAALGQRAAWTGVFPAIHLELGNEMWNSRSFAGATIADPTVYGQRAGQVFAAMRAAPGYTADRFDLVLGSWAAVPWWTGQELTASSAHDSVAVAPYLFNEFNDAASTEAIFGPMLAEPEMADSRPDGSMAQQLRAARTAPHPARLAVYEVNLGTMSGSVGQADIDRSIPSMGAGLAVVDHMLLMLRDLGVTTQCLFALPEFVNDFNATGGPGSGPGGPKKTTPLWGAVVDMGGPTNLRRPQFLALQLANSAMLSSMLTTRLSGANHTWDQPLSANAKIRLDHAQMLQTFAFAEGSRRSLIVLNLSRGEAIPVAFAGAVRPAGTVEESRLTAAHITDTNEQQSNVSVTRRHIDSFHPADPYVLPPFSMTVLTWTAK